MKINLGEINLTDLEANVIAERGKSVPKRALLEAIVQQLYDAVDEYINEEIRKLNAQRSDPGSPAKGPRIAALQKLRYQNDANYHARYDVISGDEDLSDLIPVTT